MVFDEAWKKAYSSYLEEQESSLESAMVDLIEGQNDVIKGYQYIIEYFEAMPLEDGSVLKEEEKKEEVDAESITSYLMKQLGTKILSSDVSRDIDKAAYKPVEGYSVIEKISDMKFPKNIIFFIKQLIEWIKRVVVYFIEKMKNVFRALLGRTGEIKELNPEALKLKLEKAKKLETIKSFVVKDGKPEIVKATAIKAEDIKPYYALKEAQTVEDVETLEEGFMQSIFKEKEPDIKKSPVVVTIDLSRDLLSLKEFVQHFYDLYDGAFGSNNENLFTTDDLSVILQIFKDTIKGIKKGEVNTVEIGSNAVEVSAIDASRVKENLIRTNANVNALKGAYEQTSAKIKDIARIITHKELLMLSGYGIDKKWLTSATYEQMIEILKTIKVRLSVASYNEKALDKMQKKFEKISSELTAMQSYFLAIGNVSYTSVYQRRIVDLCNAAKAMTQLTTLRLAALGLYIKELRDIRDLLKAIANVSNAN